MAGWRKARGAGTTNYVKGTRVLSIQIKYKVNTIVGYQVKMYDFSKFVNVPKGRVLKTFKTKREAIAFRLAYMKKK